MFGANARMSIIANQAPPAEIEREEELMCELRTKLGPGPEHERLLYHIRSARGKVHWAVNSYLREVMSAPGAMTQPQTGTNWTSHSNKTSNSLANNASKSVHCDSHQAQMPGQNLHLAGPAGPTSAIPKQCDTVGNAAQLHGVAGDFEGCSLEGLPVGVLEHVIHFLSCPKDVIRTAMTCRTLFRVATYDKVWQSMFTSRWGEVVFPTRPGASLLAGSARRRAMSLSLNLNVHLSTPAMPMGIAATTSQPVSAAISQTQPAQSATVLQTSISTPVGIVPSSIPLEEGPIKPTASSIQADAEHQHNACTLLGESSLLSSPAATKPGEQQAMRSPGVSSKVGNTNLTKSGGEGNMTTASSTQGLEHASGIPSSGHAHRPQCASTTGGSSGFHAQPGSCPGSCPGSACGTVSNSLSAPILNSTNTQHVHDHHQHATSLPPQQKIHSLPSAAAVNTSQRTDIQHSCGSCADACGHPVGNERSHVDGNAANADKDGASRSAAAAATTTTTSQQCSLQWLRKYVYQLSWESRRACPSCGSHEGKIVPILYGFPSPALLVGMRSGRLILGGDHLIEDCHCWACTACNASFRTYPYEQPHLWLADHEKVAERAALMKQRRNQQAQQQHEPGAMHGGQHQQNGDVGMEAGLGGVGLHGNAGHDFDDDHLPTYTYEL